MRGLFTDSSANGYHGPRPREVMKNVDITPVLHEHLPCGMGNTSHKERVQKEHGVNEELDICEIFRESDVIYVDLKQ